MWANHGEFTGKEYTGRKRRRRIWKRAVAALSCAVVFSTTYMLILPAITEEQTTYCGHEEHKHDAACYEKQLICELDDQTPHVHSDACYKEEQVLICGEEENAGHTHGADCVRKDSVLICSEEHEHTDACYQTEDTYVCGLAEGEGAHTHDPECYQTQKTLICGQSEGETHVHADACYEEILTCHKEEHEHSLACFSDPNADVEMQDAWERTMADVQLTGAWADDVIAIAKSQLGYEESTKNYTVTDDGKVKGYSRYGAWYGNPYGDWSAMFASFCLHYAGVEGYPLEASGSRWVEKLKADALFFARDEDMPAPGDLIFLDRDADGTADHVGIVAEMTELEQDTTIRVIEGDSDNCVRTVSYSAVDSKILGYGILPENPAYSEAEVLAPQKPGGDNDYLALTPMPAPDYIGTVNKANQWQTTKEEYAGREQSNKIPVDGNGDGKPDVYLQKNVVPTGTENEFLVYLSMDKKITMQTFFDNSTFGITTSNGIVPGTYIKKINGKSTSIGAHGEYGTQAYLIQINVYQHKGDSTPIYSYRDTRYGGSPNCSNGTFYMTFPGMTEALALQNNTTLKTDGSGQGQLAQANVYLDNVNADFALFDTVFDEVTDIMGEHIEFLGVVQSDGTASFDTTTNTLTWNPKDNETVISPIQTGPPITGWENNISQLVYRVRLRTEDADFNSCAENLKDKQASITTGESYAVNQSATLTYHFAPIEGASGTASESKTAAYPVPEVRGVRYDLRFAKVNEKGRQLAGAVFGLYAEDGITPILKADGTPWTVTTDAGALSGFTDLSCGTYVLKELVPPAHYNAGAESSWTVRLCYTEDQGRTLVLDETDGQNLRYSGKDTNGRWEIVNARTEFTYQLQVIKTDDTGNTYLQNVSFTVTDPNGGTPLSGVTDENGCITFDAIFRPGIEYVLTETAAPDGYQMLPADIRFVVRDNRENDTQTVEVLNKDELNGLVDTTLSDDGGVTMLVIHVKNQAGYVLPETGGPGTTLFTLCGLALMAMVGALMYRYHVRLRRERRDEQS